jgi:hypothetical protein
MNKTIEVPPHIPPEAAEAYREFVIGQQVQQLLVDYGVGRVKGAMILAFVMSRCLEQIDHPLVLQQAFMMIGMTTEARINAYNEHLVNDPAVRMRSTVGGQIHQKLYMKESARAPLVFNIEESLFKVDPAPGSEGEETKIVLAS